MLRPAGARGLVAVRVAELPPGHTSPEADQLGPRAAKTAGQLSAAGIWTLGLDAPNDSPETMRHRTSSRSSRVNLRPFARLISTKELSDRRDNHGALQRPLEICSEGSHG
jgi:hypothetical protein